MTTHTTPAASEAWNAGYDHGFGGKDGKSGKHLVPKHLHAEYEKGKAKGEADRCRIERSGR